LKFLIIGDETGLRQSITAYLNGNGDICENCNCPSCAFDKLADHDYDCVLLDIDLQDGDGFAVLDFLKSKRKNEAVLIISAKNSLDDKIKALNSGADDYLTKPFHFAELKARAIAICRRKLTKGDDTLVYNEISINLPGRTVSVCNTTIMLTRKEYDLLVYFITNKGKVVSKNALAGHLWGDEMGQLDHYDFIYTHIKNLRKKLLDAGSKDYLKSIYGTGYKFMEI